MILRKIKLFRISYCLVVTTGLYNGIITRVPVTYKDENEMKVVLVNGSPNANGCTFTGLTIIKEQLALQGVASEIFQVGKKPIIGCTACRACKQPGKAGRCVFDDDMVNTVGHALREADGSILGSAVHYASATGAATSFFDRLFYSLEPAAKN